MLRHPIRKFNPEEKDQFKDLFETTIRNMRRSINSEFRYTFVCTGETGVGKTSYINIIAQALGLYVLEINTPSLCRDHVRDIYFCPNPAEGVVSDVYDKYTDETSRVFTPKTYFSESWLQSEIERTIQTKISDEKYLQNLYFNDKYFFARELYEKIGGTYEKIPENIQELRSNFRVILFIDDYWRGTSPDVRSSLLKLYKFRFNSKSLPSSVFVVFASSDSIYDELEGVKEISFSAGILTIEQPKKEDWFAWFRKENEIITNFADSDEKKCTLKVRENVLKTFFNDVIIEKSDLLFRNSDAPEVFVSPRRWREVIYYVDQSLKELQRLDANIKNFDINYLQELKNLSVKALVSNVKIMFSNYLSGRCADLYYERTINGVFKLIEETNHNSLAPVNRELIISNRLTESTDWRIILEHQIKIWIYLGGARKNIPIISGKFSTHEKVLVIENIAETFNMGLIFVNCLALNEEHLVGKSVPTKVESESDDRYQTKFSSPALYDLIMRERAVIKESNSSCIIFFDKINCVSESILLGKLRKILAEKSFGHGLDIPSDCMIIGSIVSADDADSIRLDSYTSDIFDIIS